jgi:cytochrome bd-type quinol oxidase subunit 2
VIFTIVRPSRSPSGCTFWGKKPWSRKKKILWQVGMLIGAPVGIALIAGIAVPAIVIGIPVWVGRRIYQNSLNTTRHKRNLIIMGGVMASVSHHLTSPCFFLSFYHPSQSKLFWLKILTEHYNKPINF